MEVDRKPPQEVIDKITNDCNISEKNLTVKIFMLVYECISESITNKVYFLKPSDQNQNKVQINSSFLAKI